MKNLEQLMEREWELLSTLEDIGYNNSCYMFIDGLELEDIQRELEEIREAIIN